MQRGKRDAHGEPVAGHADPATAAGCQDHRRDRLVVGLRGRAPARRRCEPRPPSPPRPSATTDALSPPGRDDPSAGAQARARRGRGDRRAADHLPMNHGPHLRAVDDEPTRYPMPVRVAIDEAGARPGQDVVDRRRKRHRPGVLDGGERRPRRPDGSKATVASDVERPAPRGQLRLGVERRASTSGKFAGDASAAAAACTYRVGWSARAALVQGIALTASPSAPRGAWTSAGPQPSVCRALAVGHEGHSREIWTPGCCAARLTLGGRRRRAPSGSVARTRHDVPRWWVDPVTTEVRAFSGVQTHRPAATSQRNTAGPWRRPAAPGATGRRGPASVRSPHSTASTKPSWRPGVARQPRRASTAWWCNELTSGAGTEQRPEDGSGR